MKILLVTGGAGFIGSNFIRFFLKRNKDFIVVNLDKLTYAGNLDNLREIENSPRYHFVKGDICNFELIGYVMKRFKPDYIINFAAESHVDRSINQPSIFAQTNVTGTLTLLEMARNTWSNSNYRGNRFIQVSTDEVYGSLENDTDYFLEESNLAPNSPYSASKASADMMARAYHQTFGLPVIITRCCNNYGPYQHAEKFIPTCITHALQDKPIPIYGTGNNVREWIHVLDHDTALIRALFYGKPGEIYNVGSGEEVTNLEMAGKILKILGKPQDLIEMVNDRPGHDRRYALNSYKAKTHLNWNTRYPLDIGLKETVKWYRDHMDYWKKQR